MIANEKNVRNTEYVYILADSTAYYTLGYIVVYIKWGRSFVLLPLLLFFAVCWFGS